MTDPTAPSSDIHEPTSEAFLALLATLGLDDGTTPILRLVTRLGAIGEIATLEVKFVRPGA